MISISILGIFFKTDQHSIQKGIKKFCEKGKTLPMKEIRNLAVKNDCFGGVGYNKLSQEMKHKALPLLMLMILKRNGEIKSRGCANGSYQTVCTENNERASPIPDFYSVKHACGVVAKERRCTATIGLRVFIEYRSR